MNTYTERTTIGSVVTAKLHEAIACKNPPAGQNESRMSVESFLNSPIFNHYLFYAVFSDVVMLARQW